MPEINPVFTVYPTAERKFLRQWVKTFAKQNREGLWRHELLNSHQPPPAGVRTPQLCLLRRKRRELLQQGWLRRKRLKRVKCFRSQPWLEGTWKDHLVPPFPGSLEEITSHPALLRPFPISNILIVSISIVNTHSCLGLNRLFSLF